MRLLMIFAAWTCFACSGSDKAGSESPGTESSSGGNGAAGAGGSANAASAGGSAGATTDSAGSDGTTTEGSTDDGATSATSAGDGGGGATSSGASNSTTDAGSGGSTQSSTQTSTSDATANNSGGASSTQSATSAGMTTTGGTVGNGDAVIANHLAVAAFDSVPSEWITQAKTDLRIYYGHLSHGSQVNYGIDYVAGVHGELYSRDQSGFYETFYSSLDPGRDTPDWYASTREELDASDADRNIVMWAWSSNLGDPAWVDAAFVNNWLSQMETLESDYPSVVFVYMTGPTRTWLDPEDNMGQRNQQIRQYCLDNGKVLFDLEDIELHSPDAVAHPEMTHECEWCAEWCTSHASDCTPLGSCDGCLGATEHLSYTHTHFFNSYQKGKGFWWLMARLAGWSG